MYFGALAMVLMIKEYQRVYSIPPGLVAGTDVVLEVVGLSLLQ